jgi:hypothetical protein
MSGQSIQLSAPVAGNMQSKNVKFHLRGKSLQTFGISVAVLLDQAARFKHRDLVVIDHSRKPVSDREDRTIAPRFCTDHVLQQRVRLNVHISRALIHHLPYIVVLMLLHQIQQNVCRIPSLSYLGMAAAFRFAD